MQTERNIIIACTGSVATIKLPVLLEQLQSYENTENYKLNVRYF